MYQINNDWTWFIINEQWLMTHWCLIYYVYYAIHFIHFSYIYVWLSIIQLFVNKVLFIEPSRAYDIWCGIYSFFLVFFSFSYRIVKMALIFISNNKNLFLKLKKNVVGIENCWYITTLLVYIPVIGQVCRKIAPYNKNKSHGGTNFEYFYKCFFILKRTSFYAVIKVTIFFI